MWNLDIWVDNTRNRLVHIKTENSKKIYFFFFTESLSMMENHYRNKIFHNGFLKDHVKSVASTNEGLILSIYHDGWQNHCELWWHTLMMDFKTVLNHCETHNLYCALSMPSVRLPPSLLDFGVLFISFWIFKVLIFQFYIIQ